MVVLIWPGDLMLRLHYSENNQESPKVCGVCGYVVEKSQAVELHMFNL